MAERDSKDLKVLLVEDFEDTRLFMRLALEDHGFIVFEAENGQKAVENADRDKPDVILMDLTMPLMDGFAAAKLIRQKENLKTFPSSPSPRTRKPTFVPTQKLPALTPTSPSQLTCSGSK